ncbi:MAG: hypothetical protein KDE56_12975 [Anaerolineales bacterium]|nr:hypothetical protein [Anaerolineales bacterium]
MQLLIVLFVLAWGTMLKETAVFPILISAIFILILLIAFTLLIFRSRDSSDF